MGQREAGIEGERTGGVRGGGAELLPRRSGGGVFGDGGPDEDGAVRGMSSHRREFALRRVFGWGRLLVVRVGLELKEEHKLEK